MRDRVEVGNAGRSRVRYLLALVFAMLLAFGAAVPVFAAEEPAEEDGGPCSPRSWAESRCPTANTSSWLRCAT